MQCIIPGNNVKVLAKALQALSKNGDELYIDAREDRLSFITLNSSKTVYSRVHLLEIFFSSYELDMSPTNDPINCKVQMKIFLPLFKGHPEKKLDFIKLEYASDRDFLIFKMKYKCDDLLMVHNLRLMDSETLTIGVNTDSSSNTITASSSFFNQMLAMFNVSDNEIALEITTEKVVIRNYCIGTPCRPKTMRTQINLNASEFNSYNITKSTNVNFALKPFRTVVHFAENFNLDVDLRFEFGGKPLSIVMKNPTFEMNFIVATLDPYSDTNSSFLVTNSTSDEDLVGADQTEVGVKKARMETNDEQAKTVFGRCYDNTFHETVLGEVLAVTSDSE